MIILSTTDSTKRGLGARVEADGFGESLSERLKGERTAGISAHIGTWTHASPWDTYGITADENGTRGTVGASTVDKFFILIQESIGACGNIGTGDAN
jgi:hypothetical protein